LDSSAFWSRIDSSLNSIRASHLTFTYKLVIVINSPFYLEIFLSKLTIYSSASQKTAFSQNIAFDLYKNCGLLMELLTAFEEASFQML
jgi:hypothetical protein